MGGDECRGDRLWRLQQNAEGSAQGRIRRAGIAASGAPEPSSLLRPQALEARVGPDMGWHDRLWGPLSGKS